MNTRFGAYSSKYSKEYFICGINVGVYYYLVNKRKPDPLKKTPFNKNITTTDQFEGQYHPSSKIKEYPDLTITEEGIKDNNLKQVIYNYKRHQGVENLNLSMIIGLLVTGFHSLKLRYEYDLTFINSGFELDYKHVIAGQYTIKFIKFHLLLLKPEDKKCVNESLKKYFDSIEYYSKIYSGKLPKRQLF